MSNAISRILISFSLVAILGASVVGQQRPALTPDDYTRAERFLAPAVTPLVVGGAVSATWLPDDRFWYRNAIAGGTEFILVDPVKKTRARAFNHEKVAAALSAASNAKLDPLNLRDSGPDAVPRRHGNRLQPCGQAMELRCRGREVRRHWRGDDDWRRGCRSTGGRTGRARRWSRRRGRTHVH